MGKTNLISAMHQSLSFIFAKDREKPQYNFISSSDCRIRSFSPTDPTFGRNKLGVEDYQYPIEISSKATIDENSPFELSWALSQSASSGGMQTNLYEKANNIFWDYYLNHIQDLPVLAYFSDSYPHITSRIGSKMQKKLNSGKPLPSNTGYYKWDDEHHCTEIWVTYFVMQMKNAIYQKDKEKKKYTANIAKKMIEFSQPLVEGYNEEIRLKDLKLEARQKKDVLVFEFEDGRKIPYQELPQGYKRLFSIAFDISSRSYILNNNCNPSGIIFLDELELHLHPSLAQEVLPRLMKVFPRLQFVATTHSPVVLSNIHNDMDNIIIYRLVQDKNKTTKELITDDYFGLDANNVLEDAMLSYPMSVGVFKEVELINELIKARELQKASDAVNDLSKMTSENHPIVIRLNSLINRLKILGK
jgi:predicted ATP-binding protein involved in virulence